MNSQSTATHWRVSRLVAFGLFLFSASVFLLTTSGREYSSDGSQTYYTAESLLRGTIAIDATGEGIGAHRAHDGHYYSKFGPTLTILQVPVYLGLQGLAATLKLDDKSTAQMLRAWVPILANIAVASAIPALVYLIVLRLGYGSAIGVAIGLLAGFSTPLWIYATIDLTEPLQAALLLLVFWLLLRTKPPMRWHAPLWIGVTLALLILTKSVFVLLGPVLLAALLWQVRATGLRSMLIAALAFGLPALAGLLLFLGWNYLRFGSPFEFGYSEGLDTPLLIGLHGWFFSSGKSVFLYAPLLILLVGAMPHFARRHRFETIVITAITVPLVILHSKYLYWHGDWAWGPRYAVPLVSLWLLPLASVLEIGKLAWKSAVATFGALGVFVQILGIMIAPEYYLRIHAFQITPVIHPGKGPDLNQSSLDVHYVPDFSPIAGHWWLLKATLEQMRSPAKTPSENVALQNYPWARPRERLHWKPDHPEYALGPNLWMFQHFPYISKARGRAIMGLASAAGVIGISLIIIGLMRGDPGLFRRSRRAEPETKASGTRVDA